MKPAPKPMGEAARLEILRALRILDTDPEERYDRLTRLARRLFNVPMAAITLIDADRLWFKSEEGLGLREAPRDTSFCGHTILNDDMLVVPDTRDDERFHDNPYVAGGPQLRFYVGCPLTMEGGSKVGTICLFDTEPRSLSDADLNLLRDIAKIAQEEMSSLRLAISDELTGLVNRRGFLSLAQNAFKRCTTQGKPSSLLYIDLNGFKSINDQHGHAEGDQALIAFAELLRTAFRETDVIGRLGGDEFAVYLPDSSSGEQQLARLREHTRQANEGSGKPYLLQFSAGHVVVDPQRHTSIDQLLHQGDAEMYEQKHEQKRSR